MLFERPSVPIAEIDRSDVGAETDVICGRRDGEQLFIKFSYLLFNFILLNEYKGTSVDCIFVRNGSFY